MNITWLEMKKALCSPVILGLLGIFIVFNIFTIVSGSYHKSELGIVNEIIEKYGLHFNDSSLKTMQEDLNREVRTVDSGFQEAPAFLHAMTAEKYNKESKKKQHEIDRMGLMQSYINMGKALDQRYSELKVNELKEPIIQSFHLHGTAKELVSNEYKKLGTRLEEIKHNEEYKQWFFAGAYQMHTKLFRDLLKNIALEGIMLVALMTALIANYEFEHRSHLVTYSTKRGRHIVWNKLVATLLMTILLLIPLFAVSLLTFFHVYDYSRLWGAQISSGLNWENKWPHVTWWPVEFKQYLWLAIAIIVMALLIVSILTFTVSIFVRNSYITWITVTLLLTTIFILPSFFIKIPTLFILFNFNLTSLLLNPHMYFSGSSTIEPRFEHQEMMTLFIYLAIGLFCGAFAIRKLYRKDIV